FVVADLAADALKAVVDRRRPRVDHLVSLPGSSSLPSGHAATSFACALVLARLVPRLAAPLLVLAAAISYSRLYVGVHYPSDVVAGAVLGVAVATGLRLFAERRPRRRRAQRA